jgi:hypothetical protein
MAIETVTSWAESLAVKTRKTNRPTHLLALLHIFIFAFLLWDVF